MLQYQHGFMLAVGLVIGGLVYLLSPILTPFLVGALLAYLADPIADRLEAAGCSRTSAVIIVFVALTLALITLLLVLLPQLSYQIKVLVERAPQLLQLFEQQLLPWLVNTFGVDPATFQIASLRRLLVAEWQTTGDLLAQLLGQISRSGMAVATWIANLVLIPVVTFYLLRDWDVMVEKIGHLLPRSIEPRVALWARESDEVLGAFMKGQLLVMLALGTVYSVGLWLVGLDLALLVGMIAGLASIVPYMGFIIGILVAGAVALMQFQDPMILVWVGMVFVVGQMLEGMLLTPLLVGDRIGLHPVAVIFAIMAGGQLFGFVGVLLALPIAAVIMVLLRHLHDDYKNSALYHTAHSRPVPEPVDDAVPEHDLIETDEQVTPSREHD
ncbi:AI-2E family transporter [Neptuniibacter sp. CAU 1671]|uniref:AI-2E family transporter n=1 Tax=Neptuniibacter sp. CAU 1671 TaxID=3032593 RepID=UPI0023DB4081|nr:AI-2E family transporter [Neptuniibacter sp. CAU 1671]MDF2183146.1 AI-2E family transporter [Neptuniibacter sp. CAU 1671]